MRELGPGIAIAQYHQFLGSYSFDIGHMSQGQLPAMLLRSGKCQRYENCSTCCFLLLPPAIKSVEGTSGLMENTDEVNIRTKERHQPMKTNTNNRNSDSHYTTPPLLRQRSYSRLIILPFIDSLDSLSTNPPRIRKERHSTT